MKGEAGFTLIEALVSLVLGAMVLAAVLGTVKVAGRGAGRATAALADAEGFARAGAALAGDVAHMVWPGGARALEGGPDRVQMVILPRPAGDGRPRPPEPVEYHIAQGVLWRGEGAGGADAEIWRAPGRLEFRFLDAEGIWQRDWDREGLPRAVAVADPSDDVPRLVAEVQDLIPMACTEGPGPDCPLPMEAFP